MDDHASVIRKLDSRSFMEGAEHCREYVRNEILWFGTSTVPVGETGAIDTGHSLSTEVFFCCAGTAVVHDGAIYHELNVGDALLIPPRVPHTISNVGTEPVLIIWAGAPGE
jgi:mannose-6-phosphate isomerase-like protein (cupin superfamily)